jgi:hypothetical protein
VDTQLTQVRAAAVAQVGCCTKPMSTSVLVLSLSLSAGQEQRHLLAILLVLVEQRPG